MTTGNTQEWKTKPTDRFVLRWIKCHLSARVTPLLSRYVWIRPWMVTVFSAGAGLAAGVLFAMGWPLPAGVVGAVSQVLDGVDGQLARLTGRETRYGAFLDSVLDRYADGAMVMGIIVYAAKASPAAFLWLVLSVGALALFGSNLVSYAKARADGLGISLGKPTLASKGTRVTAMSISGLLGGFWPAAPLLALGYLAVHSNCVVAKYIAAAKK